MSQNPFSYYVPGPDHGHGMTRREVAALALRLAALYSSFRAVDACSFLFFNLYAFRSIVGSQTMWMLYVGQFMLPALMYGAIAAILWFRADKLAVWFLSRIPDDPTVFSLAAAEVQTIAFSIIGVYLVAAGIASLMFGLSAIALDSGAGAASAGSNLVGGVTQLAIGLFLFLRGHGRAVLWDRIRSTHGVVAGVPTTQSAGAALQPGAGLPDRRE
jgi:hypothetical protein